MLNVSAVIVTYNRVALLKKCINALLNQSYELSHIIVINNCSTDNTKKFLKDLSKQYSKEIIVRNMKINLGGAGGFSVGTKIAFEHTKSKLFWLMDDDSIPSVNALKNLVVSYYNLHGDFGFLCSNVRFHGKPCIPNVPHVSNDWNEYLNLHLVKLIYATFVSLIFKREVVSKLGLPISNMFIWGDDTEYTTRLSRYSRSYLVSNSIVNHNTSKNRNNESIFNVDKNRIFYYKCGIRNLIYINRKYYGLFKSIKLILRYVHTIFRIPFKSKNHRLIRIFYVLNGIIRGIIFNPKIRFPKKLDLNNLRTRR